MVAGSRSVVDVMSQLTRKLKPIGARISSNRVEIMPPHRFSPASCVRLLPVVLALSVGACGDGDGPTPPSELGTVVVRVRDEQAAPVLGAAVRVELPRTGGGVYEVGSTTRADGSWTLTAVPAGTRRVSVAPPSGYVSGAEPSVRSVVVVGGQTTSVDFVLRRSTGAVSTPR